MDISEDAPGVLMKYIRGLHRYLQNEIALFEVHSIDDACMKSLYIKNHGKRKASVGECSKRPSFKKNK